VKLCIEKKLLKKFIVVVRSVDIFGSLRGEFLELVQDANQSIGIILKKVIILTTGEVMIKTPFRGKFQDLEKYLIVMINEKA